jgi:hypothetical protein
MRTVIILMILISTVCLAKNEMVDGVTYMCDDTYSNQDFTGKTFTDSKDFKSIAICGSCFSKEIPDTKVFPDNMTGVTFIDCNLDNVFIPPGNTIIRGSHKRFKAQNDGEDWIVDAQGAPVEPVDKEKFIKLKISTDPKDIPQTKEVKPVTLKKIDDIELQKIEAAKAAVEAVEKQ